MRVYVPHCAGMLRPEVPARLDELGIGYELVEHSREDDSAYPWLFTRWWERGESFAIVEQDMYLHAGVFPAWETCGHRACGFPYTIGATGELFPWLGCTQFSAQLIAEHPDLAWRANHYRTPGWPAWHWKILDLRVKQELALHGLRIEAHLPAITHLHYEPVPTR